MSDINTSGDQFVTESGKTKSAEVNREFTKPQFSQNSRTKISLGDRCLYLSRIAATSEERFRQMGLLYEIEKKYPWGTPPNPVVLLHYLALKQSQRQTRSCTIFLLWP